MTAAHDRRNHRMRHPQTQAMGDGQDEHPSRGCLLPDIPPRNDQIPAVRGLHCRPRKHLQLRCMARCRSAAPRLRPSAARGEAEQL